MGRTVGIGHQDFEKVRVKNNFYIDKTDFIKEWWEADDEVTLITRPRRFGKTLTMKVIILLDEYDTPMQETYVNRFWDELVAFTRSMFNASFRQIPIWNAPL